MNKPLCSSIAVGLCALWRAMFCSAASEPEVNSAWLTRVWQTDEGLPENSVKDIAQTPDGYLWVATDTTLARFDGLRFQKVAMPLPETPEWTHPALNRMLLADGSEFWLAFEGGGVVSLSSTKTNLYAPANGTPRLKPVNLVRTADHSIWVGYADGSLSRIADGRVSRFEGRTFLPGTSQCWIASDLQNGQLWFAKGGNVGVFRDGRFVTLHVFHRDTRITAARSGGLWVWSGTAFFRFQEGKESVKLDELSVLPKAGTDLPNVMFEDRLGAVWIGMGVSGVFRYDGSRLSQVPPSYSGIVSIVDDREGNVWIGSSGGGLYRLRPRVVALLGAESGVMGTVQSICEDNDGGLWATTQSGLIRRQNGVWEPVSPNEIKLGVRCVAEDSDGSVWLGSSSGVYQCENNKFRFLRFPRRVSSIRTRVIMTDKAGNLWLGLEPTQCVRRSSEGVWHTIPLPTGSREIRAMAEDPAGKIWMGTENGLLLRAKDDELLDETPREISRSEPIRALFAARDGSLWIGFSGTGLGRLQAGRFSRVRPEQGLYNGNIGAIAGGGGALWFASGRGIFQVSESELNDVAGGRSKRLQSMVYGQDEGLPSLEGSYDYAPRMVMSRDGLIYFGMRKGLVVVHPERIQTNTVPPMVLLERVAVDGRPLDFFRGEDSLRLPPDHRKLELEFTAPSCVAPAHILFRHRLEGFDDDWSEADTKREVSYPRLPAGHYQFRVSARNNAGVWSELSVPLKFRVTPFFWQTWWFMTLAGLGLVGLVTAAVGYLEKRRSREEIRRLKQNRAVERERARIAKDIHDELGAGLTQISLAADLGASQPMEPEQAQRNFSKIGARATGAVSALDEIVWAVNPRNDNLFSLANYLCQVADDCFDSGPVRCRKDVPTGLPPVPIRAELRHNLTLAVKEALTNALKHSGGDTVWLRLVWHEPELRICVEDDGAGFEAGDQTVRGNGLKNQAARMKEVGGTVLIESNPGSGTRTTFRVRLTAAGRSAPIFHEHVHSGPDNLS